MLDPSDRRQLETLVNGNGVPALLHALALVVRDRSHSPDDTAAFTYQGLMTLCRAVNERIDRPGNTNSVFTLRASNGVDP